MSDATPTRPIVIIGKNAKTGVRVNKRLCSLVLKHAKFLAARRPILTGRREALGRLH